LTCIKPGADCPNQWRQQGHSGIITAMSTDTNPKQAVLQAYIKSHDILGSLSPANQEKLAASSKLHQWEEGRLIFSQGQEGASFFALCHGTVKVYRSGTDGREAVVKILNPGEIFGEVVLFKQFPYPANALCLNDVVLVEVAKAGLLALLADEAFRLDFIGGLMQKLQYLTGRVYMLGALDVEERFFQYIISSYGIRESYELDLSKKDLAAAIGTVPETLSRLLQRLKVRGTILWEGKELRIDSDTLRFFADEFGQ